MSDNTSFADISSTFPNFTDEADTHAGIAVEPGKAPDQISMLLEGLRGILSTDIPDAYKIWMAGQKYLASGDVMNAAMCQRLNYILHNSWIPNKVKMGEGVQFGYGGIGLVLHESCKIDKYAVIGANVTLGGRARGSRINSEGQSLSFPHIREYAYIATGSKILGGVTVGALAIVGANAVVTEEVPPLTIVSGVPAKEIKRITPDNCLRYKSMYLPLRKMADQEFIQLVKRYSN